MSRFRSALALLRDINAGDLVMPIGAALVGTGLQHLAERERRQRTRLAELQRTVNDHLDALLAAGVDVGALAVDERHPLDQPGLAGPDYRIAGNGNSETSSNSYPDGRGVSSGRRRRWKLAAAALAVSAGVAYAFRGQLAELVLPYLDAAGADDELAEVPRFYPGDRREPVDDAPFGPIRTETIPDEPASPWDRAEPATYPAHSHDYTAGEGSECSVCGAPGVAFAGLQEPVKADLTPEPAVDEPAVDEPEVVVVPPFTSPDEVAAAEQIAGDECGWTGCTWKPRDATRGAARVTALAVHRAKCPHRPASYTVPGA